MKFILVTLLLLMPGPFVAAQEEPFAGLPSESMQQGTWHFGVFGGGGAGLAQASGVHFAYFGTRTGLILTKEHFTGWRRGNFEWAVDLMPLYTVFTPAKAVYGGSFKPAVWIWNFTSGRTISPYVAIAGGILFSTGNLPPGNTSWVNFSPQAAVGANLFLRRGRALRLEGAYVHHSSAGLGTLNPGYNASLFFTIGYSWFRGSR